MISACYSFVHYPLMPWSEWELKINVFCNTGSPCQNRLTLEHSKTLSLCGKPKPGLVQDSLPPSVWWDGYAAAKRPEKKNEGQEK
jgi:hypothetical protein